MLSTTGYMYVETLDSCGNVMWWQVPVENNLREGADFILNTLPPGSVKLSEPPNVSGLIRCRQNTTTTKATTTTTTTTTKATTTTTTSGTTTKQTTTTGTTTTASPVTASIVALYSFETDYQTTSGTTTTGTTTTSTSSSTTTKSTGVFGSAYFRNGYGEGNFEDLKNFAPFIPTQNQNFGTGNVTQYLSNGKIKAGFLKSVGGAITHLSINGGYNRINTNAEQTTIFEGEQAPDTGRSAGPSTYAYPWGGPHFGGKPFIWTEPITGQTQSTSPYDGADDTGWNPVIGGSRNQDRSKILQYERKTVAGYGEVIYIKTQPYHWSLIGVLAEVHQHMWYWLEDQRLCWFFIQDLFRSDNQMKGVGREQELYFAYIDGDLHNYIINNTGSNLINIQKPAPCEGAGTPTCPNQTDTGAYFSVGNWIAGLDNNNDGVIIHTPYNSRFRGKQFQGFGGNEFTNMSSYINASCYANFDKNGASAWAGSMFCGKLDDFRAWHSASAPQGTRTDWKFGYGQTQGWWADESDAIMNSNGEYVFNAGQDVFCKFRSPFFSAPASSMSKIYVRTKQTGGLSKMRLMFMRSTDTQLDGNQKIIDCISDGQYRTYVFDMAGVPNFDGTIVNLALTMGYDNAGQLSHSERIIPAYIGTVNPDITA